MSKKSRRKRRKQRAKSSRDIRVDRGKRSVEVINGMETDVITYHQKDFASDEINIYIQTKWNQKNKSTTYDVSEVWDGLHTGRHVDDLEDWLTAYYHATMWADDLEGSQWIDTVRIVPPVSLALDNEWLRTTISDIRVVTSDVHLMLKHAEAKYRAVNDKNKLKVSEVLQMMSKKDLQEDKGILRNEVRSNKNWPRSRKKDVPVQTKWLVSQSVEEVLF